jgi:methyl-accepting chemotaxis protein
MTLISSDLRRAPQLAALDTTPLKMVIRSTESTFLAAGNNLEQTVTALRRLKALFPRLEAGMGPEAGAEFAATIEALKHEVDGLSVSLGEFVSKTEDLGGAVLRMNRDIADLDRVVRTIGTLSITARVIGHAMSPPQPKVAAFVENLAHMAVEAEDVLTGVKEAMADIRTDMVDLTETVGWLHNTLTRQVFGVLGGLSAVSNAIQHSRADILVTNTALARQMGETFAEVSRLIMALQVGDSVRQRFGRVQETLRMCNDMPDIASLAVGLDLANRLTVAARSAIAQDLAEAVHSLSDLGTSSSAAIHTARDFYLGAGAGRNLEHSGVIDDAAALPGVLNEVQDHLAALRQRTERVVDRLQRILDQERTLRQIAQKVRLAGVNAVVICTHLGRQGNALREVAQWLRGMTDEADDITGHLQGALDGARGLIGDLGRTSVERLSSGTALVVTRGAAMHGHIQTISGLIAEAKHEIAHAAKALPALLEPTRRSLCEYLLATRQLDPLLAAIVERRSMLPDPVLPFYVGSPAAEVMDSLRRGYTMEAERTIHDDVVGLAPPRAEQQGQESAVADAEAELFFADAVAAAAPMPETCSDDEPEAEPDQGAEAATDLDDVLF